MDRPVIALRYRLEWWILCAVLRVVGVRVGIDARRLSATMDNRRTTRLGSDRG